MSTDDCKRPWNKLKCMAGIPIITPRARAAFFASIGNLLRQLLWKGGPNISAIEGDEGHEGNEGVESHKGYWKHLKKFFFWLISLFEFAWMLRNILADTAVLEARIFFPGLGRRSSPRLQRAHMHGSGKSLTWKRAWLEKSVRIPRGRDRVKRRRCLRTATLTAFHDHPYIFHIPYVFHIPSYIFRILFVSYSEISPSLPFQSEVLDSRFFLQTHSCQDSKQNALSRFNRYGSLVKARKKGKGMPARQHNCLTWSGGQWKPCYWLRQK